MRREAGEDAALVDRQSLRLAMLLEGAGEMLVGAEHQRQQEVVERMRVARLDQGAARHVDRRMIDREP